MSFLMTRAFVLILIVKVRGDEIKEVAYYAFWTLLLKPPSLSLQCFYFKRQTEFYLNSKEELFLNC